MLIGRDVLDRIASGEVSLAFRSWKRPTVRSGGTLRTAVGVLHIDEVTAIGLDDIADADAIAAGAASRDEVIASLRHGDDRQLYRIRIRHTDEDPRIRLRARSEITADERAEIDDQLERWDVASRDGPWTRQTLDLIATHPGERSAELARRIDTDQQRLKRRVRQLHNLGLTESLATGYRLSSRGHSFRSPDFPPDATVR